VTRFDYKFDITINKQDLYTKKSYYNVLLIYLHRNCLSTYIEGKDAYIYEYGLLIGTSWWMHRNKPISCIHKTGPKRQHIQ